MKSQPILIVALIGAVAFGLWQWQKNEPPAYWEWNGPHAYSDPYQPAAVPVTLPDGRKAYLMVQPTSESYPGAVHPAVYRSPAPVTSQERVVYTSSPVVERQVIRETRSPVPEQRGRSWEREVLIVAGSAGAGTAIGAIAGGKKGAAVGAVSGGVAGLVYDLATRNKDKDRH